jgi:hypothetical protein
MREVNLSQSLASIMLIFSLLISVIKGDVNTFADEVSHGTLIIKRADIENKTDRHLPYGLNGKEEENRSEKKSVNHLTAFPQNECASPIINQSSGVLHTSLSTWVQAPTKVPRYLLERSLLI